MSATLIKDPKYNKNTISAINEAKDIMSGKVDAKTYGSAKELFDELDAEKKTDSQIPQ